MSFSKVEIFASFVLCCTQSFTIAIVICTVVYRDQEYAQTLMISQTEEVYQRRKNFGIHLQVLKLDTTLFNKVSVPLNASL